MFGLTPKPAPKSAAADILADMRAVIDGMDKPPADTFEAAMSALTYAVGMLERNPPADATQSNRVSDQCLRLDTVLTRSDRAIQNRKAA